MKIEPIETELDTLDLGDKRLDKRGRSLLGRLAENPAQSINSACMGWDESKAAYRLFDNPNAKAQAILQAHAEATTERIKQQAVVCLDQDTTELNFSDHPPDDVRCLDHENRRGLYDHSQIAFTPEGLCLGVIDAEFYDREAESLGTNPQRHYDPIETKESFRWLKGYQKACQIAATCPQTQVVSIADREGDLYDIFAEAQRNPTPADYVIRSHRVRCTPEKDPEGGPAAYQKMRDQVTGTEVLVTRQVDLPATAKRAARTATLEVRAARVKLKPPHARASLFDPVEISVVWVREVDAPDDGTAVQWWLLSSLPIDSHDDVLRIIDLYVARWPIEIFFRVFKSGCKVEEIQLETKARLIRALMFYKVIAWRIMFMTFIGRECPDLPCSVAFEDAEWKSVWKIVRKEDPPPNCPALKDFLSVLATLGGYNNRAGDAPPGTDAIWRGLRRMLDFARCWVAFGPDAAKPK